MTRPSGASSVAAGLRVRAVAALAVVVVLVGGGGAWASTAQLDSASIASGQLSVDGEMKTVGHVSGGTVRELLVKDGAQVVAGDVLVRLHDPVLENEIAATAPAIDALTIRLARLTAESEGRDTFAVPDGDLLAPQDPAVQLALHSEQDVLAREGDVSASERRQVDRQAQQLRRELDTLSANEASLRDELATVRADLAVLAEQPTDAVAPAVVAERQRVATAIEQQLGAVRSAIASTKTSIAAENEKQTSLQSTSRLQAAQSIPLAAQDRENLRARRAELLAELQALALTAPVDGVVHELGVHAVGEIVQPGSVVARVVPTGVRLVATIKVPLVEIEAWSPGARVLLRFPGLDAETTPEVWGVVTTVSAAPSVDPSTGETNYVARLSVDDDAPGSLREAFVAGMPVEAQLQMGRRTVLSYLLKPMSDQLARALKEE
ncbi:HlyD family type I secretion periplasmic adaptor subunit [Cellulomonas xiejunii]|uniref:HlyD family type I secretion periplasmic adaptor subunit n=1 Tax=Cellulomonas xiejunii TaxID=2968083 RepID=UPI001D0E092C|nr:HlyD family type I secretion periplasmic adaptor subunit [Cellulomonas xiejunii]MCC2314054.1 HlyD family type I secretion periplasmic adaptor subunit [Cellulomonas xiejunii]